MDNVKAVILAAGESKRMKSGLTKLLHRLGRKALVEFPAGACKECGIKDVIVVVGYQADRVISVLGNSFTYIYQEKRLGTGDALKKALPLLKDFKGELLVLPGDAPFVTASVLKNLIACHRKSKPAATILTASIPDPSHYGRIIRNGYNQIKRIVEYKNATGEELGIKEVNSGVYCFDTQAVISVIPELQPNPVTGEYYLTDVVSLLNDKGYRVEAFFSKDPTIVLGVNTPEDFETAINIMRRKNKFLNG
ncbi:UDP-N-acetylglucosamine diphosphorylase [Candidatus Aerophobetes bacterium]|uniref:UDP-N-acetylglucosamine diphosphorylase n=1 Tax=Aerophobetes bacterium TaxID=2030807 RepID=A0A497E207_UNCAE|nr:MAG: UDP-N-acetylglucosamine diphosphorylase [Candidatus Aerophobetes bacterium]